MSIIMIERGPNLVWRQESETHYQFFALLPKNAKLPKEVTLYSTSGKIMTFRNGYVSNNIKEKRVLFGATGSNNVTYDLYVVCHSAKTAKEMVPLVWNSMKDVELKN